MKKSSLFQFVLGLGFVLASVQAFANDLPRLALTAEERQALHRLFTATVDEQEGMGNHLSDTYSFAKFAKLVEARLQNGGLPLDLLKKMEWSKHSPARAWLVDQRMNPSLGALIPAFLSGQDFKIAIRLVAEENRLKVGDVEVELEKISFRVAEGVGLANHKALGYLFKDNKPVEGVMARAFQLDSKGQPLQYDIGLQNLKDHLEKLRDLVVKTATNPDRTLRQRFQGYFLSLSTYFSNAVSTLETFELGILDLQGVLDAIRYKLTLSHVDTRREEESLLSLLREAIELRERLIFIAEQTERLAQSTAVRGRLPLLRALNRQAVEVEGLRRKIKAFSNRAIVGMDQILGFDTSAELSLQYDTPWELAFIADKAAASGAGLGDQWESIRTFEIIIEERHYTRRWTEYVHHPAKSEVRDSNGNVTQQAEPAWTEAVVRTSSHDETSTETIPTPGYEMQIQAKLNDLYGQIGKFLTDQGSAREIERLKIEVAKLRVEYSRYRQNAPQGKDESEHRVPRMRNQIEQMNQLETQLSVAKVRSETGVAIFNRVYETDQKAVAGARDVLARIDRFRTRVNIGIGSTIGAAAAGYTCYELLMKGGF